MDLQKYFPVGEDSAVEMTIITGSGNTLTGAAWLESNTSTEASIRATEGTLAGHVWIVSDQHIVALILPPETQQSRRKS